MEPNYELSKDTLQKLTEHLKDVQINKGRIIDEFFPEVTEERQKFETLMALYISEVDNFIKTAQPADTKEDSLPFVIMGSEVEVLDKGNNRNFEFRVVAPFKSQRESHNTFDVSCLSPVGKSLLLKKLGDTVEVKAPGGVFHYKIKCIRFP